MYLRFASGFLTLGGGNLLRDYRFFSIWSATHKHDQSGSHFISTEQDRNYSSRLILNGETIYWEGRTLLVAAALSRTLNIIASSVRTSERSLCIH